MKTSYFHLSADDPGAVSIARGKPWYFNGQEYRRLFPREDMLKDYNDALSSWDEYSEKYSFEILAPLDAKSVWRDLHDLVAPHEPVLLCWEDPRRSMPFRCHRRLVAIWLASHLDVGIPEVALEQTGGDIGHELRMERLFKE
jgi:hypothetical protein